MRPWKERQICAVSGFSIQRFTIKKTRPTAQGLVAYLFIIFTRAALRVCTFCTTVPTIDPSSVRQDVMMNLGRGNTRLTLKDRIREHGDGLLALLTRCFSGSN